MRVKIAIDHPDGYMTGKGWRDFTELPAKDDYVVVTRTPEGVNVYSYVRQRYFGGGGEAEVMVVLDSQNLWKAGDLDEYDTEALTEWLESLGYQGPTASPGDRLPELEPEPEPAT